MKLRLGFPFSVLASAVLAVPLPAQELVPDDAGAADTPRTEAPADDAGPARPRGPGSLGGPGGMANSPPGYTIAGFPATSVSGQPERLGALGQSLSLGGPVWRDDTHKVILRTNVGAVLYDTGAVFPSGQAFPEHVWNVSLGAMYACDFASGSSAGLMVNGGSASDRPFSALDVLDGSVLAFYRLPRRETDAWLFSVFYSPTSEVPFPIPGLAYHWQPSAALSVNLGVPFQLRWQALDDVSVEAAYMPVTRVRLQTCWRPDAGPLALVLAYDWNNQGYFLAERTAAQDRFFAYAMTVSGSVRYDVLDWLALEVSSGYAFARFFFIGEDFADRNADRIDVAPGAFMSAALRLRF